MWRAETSEQCLDIYRGFPSQPRLVPGGYIMTYIIIYGSHFSSLLSVIIIYYHHYPRQNPRLCFLLLSFIIIIIILSFYYPITYPIKCHCYPIEESPSEANHQSTEASWANLEVLMWSLHSWSLVPPNRSCPQAWGFLSNIPSGKLTKRPWKSPIFRGN